jgi:hypothetical protein
VGRTNPTFRDVLQRYREEWQAYRRGLRADQQAAFDALLADAERHADAAGYLNATDPTVPILLSMLLEAKRDRRALAERVATLEAHLDGIDSVDEGGDRPAPPGEG